MMDWLTDLRKTAWLASVTLTLTLPIPVWKSMQSILALESPNRFSEFWLPPVLAVLCFFTAILPVFFLALARNDGQLVFSGHLRLLSLSAAIVFCLVLAPEIPGRVRQIGDLSAILDTFSNLTMVLVLIALSRHANDGLASEVPVAGFLRVMTNMAVITWGLWVGFNLVRLLLTPYAFYQTRDYALRIGRIPPPLGAMMVDVLRTFLSPACLFTAPFVVYKSLRKSARSQA